MPRAIATPQARAQARTAAALYNLLRQLGPGRGSLEEEGEEEEAEEEEAEEEEPEEEDPEEEEPEED